MLTTAASVFSCGASRNKRDKRAFDETDWGLRTRTSILFPFRFTIHVPLGTAPGFRDSGYGELGVLHNVGHDGYSWSSSSVDSDDYYRDLDLSFNTQGLNPNSVHYRAYGLQLRCLSE